MGYNINSIENVSVSIRIENGKHYNINSRYDIERIEVQIKSKNDYYYWELQADRKLQYLENQAIDYTQRKSISLIGVRKNGGASKPHFYNIENFDFSYNKTEIIRLMREDGFGELNWEDLRTNLNRISRENKQ